MVFFIIAGVIILTDLLSKKMIRDRIEEGQKKELIKDKLFFWRTKNKGCAYGMLRNKPHLVQKTAAVVTAVVGGALCVGIAKGEKPAGLAGLAMCFGGAMGNLIDRIRNNGVTDFIYVKKRRMPIFNLADVFIFLGVIVFLVSLASKDKY